MKLYHVTDHRNLESILEHGLRTDWMGWDTGFIWGFDDETVARHSAASGCWSIQGRTSVLTLDVSGLPVIPDPHPGWGDDRDRHAFAVPHSIEPSRIQVLDTLSRT